jgi:hypothetical protein
MLSPLLTYSSGTLKRRKELLESPPLYYMPAEGTGSFPASVISSLRSSCYLSLSPLSFVLLCRSSSHRLFCSSGGCFGTCGVLFTCWKFFAFDTPVAFCNLRNRFCSAVDRCSLSVPWCPTSDHSCLRSHFLVLFFCIEFSFCFRCCVVFVLFASVAAGRGLQTQTIAQ